VCTALTVICYISGKSIFSFSFGAAESKNGFLRIVFIVDLIFCVSNQFKILVFVEAVLMW
jgi:hypothetical protein